MHRRTAAAYVLSAGLVAATGAGALAATATSKPTGGSGTATVRHVVPTTVITRVVDVVDPGPSVTAADHAAASGPGVLEEPTNSGTPATAPGATAPATEPPVDATPGRAAEQSDETLPAHTETTEAGEPPHAESGESEHERESDGESHGSTDVGHVDD